MSKPYDATTKHLIETYPADWLALAGLSGVPFHLEDADLSTLTAAADRVFRVMTDPPQVVHLELQAGYLATLDARTLFQNVALQAKYGLPVLSTIVLLHPQANSPRFTGKLEFLFPDGRVYLQFLYQVLRVWETDAASLLSGGLGTLPLTPLARVSESELPEVIRQMERRIDAEARSGDAAELWIATYVLMGLRYDQTLVGKLLGGVRAMKESSTYQAILSEGRTEGREQGRVEGHEQGRAEEARSLLVRLGTLRFGSPSEVTQKAITAISEVKELEVLLERLLKAESWEELLAE